MADQEVDPDHGHAQRARCIDRAGQAEGELPHEIGSTTEPGLRVAENYWFNCPACGYDWPSLLMPSIIFVSLSFVTDQCPNCQKKHVPAYRVGPGR
jgi:predicted RNA-binding Zn-ribbon protein involved in translation (DUF1610 family)